MRHPAQIVLLSLPLLLTTPSWGAIEVASGEPLAGNSWGTNFRLFGAILDRIDIAILGDDDADGFAGPGLEFTTDASGVEVRDPGWSVSSFTPKRMSLTGGPAQTDPFVRVWLHGDPDDGNKVEWTFEGYRDDTRVLSDKLSWEGSSNDCYDWDVAPLSSSAAVVPEPASAAVWCLLGGLALGAGWLRRKRAA